MENFWDYSVWGSLNVVAVLLASLLGAGIFRKCIPFLKESLIPTSVLGGGILIVIVGIYKFFTGDIMFDTVFFGGKGTANLELLTYHCLALGFIASTFKPSKGKMTRKRTTEIFNTGVTTVATYLLQGIFGLLISIIAAKLVSGFFPAAGMLLPFGYGQGTGQAMNYGGIYENEFGFVGGKSFGLTIAALGFLSASLGGVIHLYILKKQGKVKSVYSKDRAVSSDQISAETAVPMQESIDKMTVQIALIFVAYFFAYLLMSALGALIPSMKSVIYGFNFLLGVLAATVVKSIMDLMKKIGLLKKEYANTFLMTRVSNFFFDIMVVAGIAAIRFGALKDSWGIIMIMAIVGLVITYFYNYLVAHTLFEDYPEEQFLMMYGMLTGTASTGVILLRELDGEFKTPASDNMVYQNFPAIVFGFPLMLLATLAPKQPVFTLLIVTAFFVFMNVILFRSVLFSKIKRNRNCGIR